VRLALGLLVGLPAAAGPLLPPAQVGTRLKMTNANVRLEYDLSTGRANFYWQNALKVAGFYSGVELQTYITGTIYSNRTWTATNNEVDITYAMSLAPVTWVVISEIFPNRIRGAAMAVVVSALWIACFTLTYTFPILNAKLGSAGTFWLYAAICVAGFIFINLQLPETKGKSLEQIERELVD